MDSCVLLTLRCTCVAEEAVAEVVVIFGSVADGVAHRTAPADREEDWTCQGEQLFGVVAVLALADLASQEAHETSGRGQEVEQGLAADLAVAVVWDEPLFDARSCPGRATS